MKLAWGLLLSVVSLFAQTTQTTVADTVKLAINGQNAVGSMSIAWPSFQLTDGTLVSASAQNITLNRGAFSIQLYPTVGATPTSGGSSIVYYTITYHLTTGASLQEKWSVPVSGGPLPISSVLVPVQGSLQTPTGDSLPSTCKTGLLFFMNGAEYICVSPNTWTALQTGAQAASLYVPLPGGNGIPFIDGPAHTRQAASGDITNLLGFTPPNPANALNEYAAVASAARQQLGVGASGTHADNYFVQSSQVNAPNGVAPLDNGGKLPLGIIPTLDHLIGNLSLSQITIAGTPGPNKYLNSDTGWAQVDWAQLSGRPAIPVKLSDLANDAGYVLGSTLAPVATSGRYVDLTGLPSYGDIVSHNIAELLLASTRGSANGVAPLGLDSKVPLTNLPTIPSTQTSGFGTAALANSSDFIAASLLGANSGVAQLNGSGKLVSTQVPAIDYNNLLNLPAIPTKLSQLTNDSGFLNVAGVAPVALSGAYADLTGKPSLNFDPAGTAANAIIGLLVASNNLSDLTNIPLAKTHLGLSTVATTGAYGDLSGKPTISAVGLSGDYADLLNKPTIPPAYVLPQASPTVLGGVKIGANITEATDGTISTSAPYTLPAATNSVLGGVIAGNHLSVGLTGILSVNTNDFDAAGAATAANANALQKANNLSDLPSVSTAKTNLGLAPVASSGDYVDLTNKPTIPAAYTLPVSSSSVLGGVKIGANVTEAVDGTISVAAPYTLPVATNSLLGGVIAGQHLTIGGTGILGVNGADFEPAGSVTAATAGLLRASNNLSDLASVAIAKTNLGLATVATTGAYSDLSGKPAIPAAYVLPAATNSTLGGVKCGTNLTCAIDGTISGPTPYALPLATTSVPGGVIVGSNLDVSVSGVLSVHAASFDAAGAATAAVVGVLKAANNLSDVASVTATKTNLGLAQVASTGDYTDLTNKPTIPAAYVLPAATVSTLGGIKVGANLAVAVDGTLSALNAYVLPQATSSILGGVKVGSNLLMDNATGALSVNAAAFDPAGAATAANATALQKANNLSDLASVTAAKTNLGLSVLATTAQWADLGGKPSFGDIITHNAAEFILATAIGANSGLATLDSSGKLTATQIPSIPVGKITGAGDILTHNANEFILATLLGANNGVAQLDANGKLASTQVPTINYSDLAGKPVLAAVATSGNYTDLLNKPAGLPPIGVAGGDLAGTYPNPTVKGLNGQNLAALGAGVLAQDSAGIPHKATNGEIQGAFGYTPLNAALNLSDLANAVTARTNLGLGTMALETASNYLKKASTPGFVVQNGDGTTRAAVSGDIGNLLGYTPLNANLLGANNGIAQLDANGKLASAQIPTIPFNNISGVPNFILDTAIGTTIAPLINGMIPSNFVPLPPLATTGAPGIMQVGNHLQVAAGVVSVAAADFDAAGTAAGFAANSLQKSANLSDLQSATVAKVNLGLSTLATTGAWADIAGKPSFAAVATSGSYTDLINKPFIPTKTSDLTNDAGFLTAGTLPIATSSTPGIVSAGTYLSVNGSGVLTVNVGNTTGTVAVGNDPRIVNAIQLNTLGQPNGPALLDTNGKLQLSETPQNIPLGYVVGWGTAAQKDIGFFVQRTDIGAALGVAGLDLNGKLPLGQLTTAIPYSFITGGPTQYVLPAATNTILGGVKVGTGLAGASDGTLSIIFGTSTNEALNGALLGANNGIAQLNGSGKIPITQIPVGVANGIASLDNNVKVPIQQLPTGANGLATLDSSGHILNAELNLNGPGGIAGLDSQGLLPISVLPTGIPVPNIGDGSVNLTQWTYLKNINGDVQSQLSALQSSLGQLLAGTQSNPALSNFIGALSGAGAQVVNVVTYGDSITRCANGYNCPVGPNTPTSRYSEVLRSYLQTKYGTHGSGVVPVVAGSGGPGTPVEWTMGGSWSTNATIGPSESGLAGGIVKMNASSTATMTAFTGDTVVIYYAIGPDTGSGFRVTVDGNIAGTYGAQTSGGYVAQKVAISVGSGSHALVITSLGSSAYIYGAEYTAGGSGVSVHNVALAAYDSDAWGQNPSAQMVFTDEIGGGEQLATIMLGTNDYNNGSSLSRMQGNLQNMINHLKSIGTGNIILMSPPFNSAPGGGGPSMSQIISMVQSLAASNNVDYFAVSNQTGFDSFGSMQSNGYISGDGIHLTDAGQQALGTALIGHIFGTANTGGGGGLGGSFNGGAITAPLTIQSTQSQGFPLTVNLNTPDNASALGLIRFTSSTKTWNMGIVSSTSSFAATDSFVLYDAPHNTFPLEVMTSDNIFIGGDLATDPGSGFIKPADTGESLQVWGGIRAYASKSSQGNTAMTIQASTLFGGGNDVGFKMQTANNVSNWSITAWEGVDGGAMGFFNNTNGTAPLYMDNNAPAGLLQLTSGGIITQGQTGWTGTTAGGCVVKNGLIISGGC